MANEHQMPSSRRRVLCGIVAASVAAAAPAIAAPNKVCALIEDHKAAYKRFCVLISRADAVEAEESGWTVTHEDEEARDAASAVEYSAMLALCSHRTETLPEERARLSYLSDYYRLDSFSDEQLEALIASFRA